MDMILRNTTISELAALFARHEKCSSAPHLVDPAVRPRARRVAKQNGIWARIDRDFIPDRDIPVIKRSDFRQYSRTGDRTRHQGKEAARARELNLAALALWLGHPRANLDYLQDLLWAYCDDWTWVMAAHEGCSVDLGSALCGATLAEILHALDGQIEPEVANRVHAEIERRVFRNVWDYRQVDFWHTANMNWNHVCNGAFVRAALLEIKDPRVLARAVHPAIQNMTYAIDGFTDDGGCEEGPGYWNFGFGHYVRAAYALYCRTGGQLNVMTDDKIARIVRYPVAAHIHGSYRACFADSGHGTIEVAHALFINHFMDAPELYELCSRRDTGQPEGAGPLQVTDMHALGLYAGQKGKGMPDNRDAILPDLGMVKLRGGPGPARMTVMALAGNNGVPHNHNDIGSFMVFKRGRLVLTDPGAPLYNAKTFSDQRYSILYCRSRGHSVPIINGHEQKAGSEYYGTLAVEGLNQNGVKRVRLDMTHAYPKGTVARLVRTLELDSPGNTLLIEDDYAFQVMPKSLEEAFVTFERARVHADGHSVGIGPRRGGVVLAAEQPGRFHVETLTAESEDSRPGGSALTRITFEPATRAVRLCLRFSVR